MMRSAQAERSEAGELELSLAGERFQPMPCGALWWTRRRTLLVSDLHLEKGSSFAARGQMLPPYDTRSTLARVARLIERLRPDLVVSLGDSFHDRGAATRMASADLHEIRRLTRLAAWIWVRGNHDVDPPTHLGGSIASTLRLDGIELRHEPSRDPFVEGEIAGHLHPVARVLGRGRSVRARCFAADGRRLVMPAYGSLTGGLNVCDPAIRTLFGEELAAAVLGRDGVYMAPLRRLAPETASPAPRRLF